MSRWLAFLSGSLTGLAVTLVAAFFFFFGLEYLIAHWFALRVEGDLRDVLGLPPFAVKSGYYLVAMSMVLLWWLVFRTRSERPSREVQRVSRTELFALISTLFIPCVYFALLYAASEGYGYQRSGKATKCYVVTPTAVFIRSAIEPGQTNVDLETGRPCTPLTAELRPRVEKLEKLRTQGKELSPIEPKATDFFSGITGEPLLWYVRDGNELRFYDVPGYDRISGEALRPVDKVVAAEWRARSLTTPSAASSPSKDTEPRTQSPPPVSTSPSGHAAATSPSSPPLLGSQLPLRTGASRKPERTAPKVAGRYLVDGAEVFDVETGLLWKRCVEGMKFDGGNCGGIPTLVEFSSVSELAVDARRRSGDYGETMWRVPTKTELSSLVKAGEPAIDSEAFPGMPGISCWTSSAYDGPEMGNKEAWAWSVFFGNGSVNYNLRSQRQCVRLVRKAR